MLEAPTWRANPDWGERLGYDAEPPSTASTAPRSSFLHERRDAHPELHDQGVLVGGHARASRRRLRAPATGSTPEGYADYHRPQLASFQAAGADLATALTLVGADEAIGIVAAARDVGLPIAVVVHGRDRRPAGRRPSLREAIEEVDAAGGPDWFLVNCAHPTHVARGLEDDGPWEPDRRAAAQRLARCRTPELDEAEELDEGDPAELQASVRAMVSRLPGLRILGGCCGTDARHVAALWGV